MATFPAVVVAIGAYAGVVHSSRDARRQIQADLEKARLERIYDRLQKAYVDLVSAERELAYQSPVFSDEDYALWNDERFRPAVATVTLLGAEDVRTCIDGLMAIYNDANQQAWNAAGYEAADYPAAMRARLDATEESRSELRSKMLGEMRRHLNAELGRGNR